MRRYDASRRLRRFAAAAIRIIGVEHARLASGDGSFSRGTEIAIAVIDAARLVAGGDDNSITYERKCHSPLTIATNMRQCRRPSML